MAKGSIAKANIVKELSKTFGKNFIGEIDKKVYLWADDGGSKVQIALTLTCPKNMVDAPVPDGNPATGWDWSETPVYEASPKEKAEITEEELTTVKNLMESLGL